MKYYKINAYLIGDHHQIYLKDLLWQAIFLLIVDIFDLANLRGLAQEISDRHSMIYINSPRRGSPASYNASAYYFPYFILLANVPEDC